MSTLVYGLSKYIHMVIAKVMIVTIIIWSDRNITKFTISKI